MSKHCITCGTMIGFEKAFCSNNCKEVFKNDMGFKQKNNTDWLSRCLIIAISIMIFLGIKTLNDLNNDMINEINILTEIVTVLSARVDLLADKTNPDMDVEELCKKSEELLQNNQIKHALLDLSKKFYEKFCIPGLPQRSI